MGGPLCVAEMTGRRGRIVRTNQNSQPHYENRESDSSSVDSLNIQEVRRGNFDIASKNIKSVGNS